MQCLLLLLLLNRKPQQSKREREITQEKDENGSKIKLSLSDEYLFIDYLSISDFFSSLHSLLAFLGRAMPFTNFGRAFITHKRERETFYFISFLFRLFFCTVLKSFS
jgi:hypothetical protein